MVLEEPYEDVFNLRADWDTAVARHIFFGSTDTHAISWDARGR
jgi:hypothetical protein